MTVTEDDKGFIEVTDIDIGDVSKEMEVGESQTIIPQVIPANGSDLVFAYESSNEKVATVNAFGRVSACGVGKVLITVKVQNKFASVEIVVKPKSSDKIPVTDLEIADYNENLAIDESLELRVTPLPINTTDTLITYKSSEPSVAKVNSQGIVTGLKKGNVTIAIHCGKIVKNIQFHIVVATKSIELNEKYIVLKPGDTYEIKATVHPSDASQSLTYTSLNPNIAMISSNGVITAKKSGNTSISVSNDDFLEVVTVIVNERLTENDTWEGSLNTTNNLSNHRIDKIIDASKVKQLSMEYLKAIYENQYVILINGDGYSISLEGKNIENYMNSFSTDIQWMSDENGESFIINRCEYLCGPIDLKLNDVKGKYLYLWNDSKKKYEMIHTDDIHFLHITSAGKYLITKERIKDSKLSLKYFGVAGLVLASLLGFIVINRRYWFW